ncbi:MAG: hypothetical protein U9N19_05470, partial [Thermodesulfobacteriota bacterium]|nr:hypothetical protein [Thermodesulfobacteriota bacterium]
PVNPVQKWEFLYYPVMLVPRALNTTKNPVNFCSTYLSPVPEIADSLSGTNIAFRYHQIAYFIETQNRGETLCQTR